MFFKDAVKSLQEKGHEVLCTSRDYREAVELARIKGLDLKLVGRHGGPERYGKLAASAERMRALADVISGFAPDAAVTFSSPEGARVAFGLGVRHIGFNDSPHAEAVAKLTVPLMSRLLCPWVIPYSSWTGFGISRKDISRYHALDPAAWLKDDNDDSSSSAHMVEPDKKEGNKTVVLIRLEESKASYIADKKLASTALVDAVVDELAQRADIVMLCRYSDQIEEAKARYGNSARIIESVVDGVSLIKSTDLFIGAGGTMSAEAALLGVPTISIAPVRYHVEDYLVRSGLVARTRNPGALAKLASRMLAGEKFRKAQKKRAERALASMENPTKKMLAAILLKQNNDHHKL
jgi:predicted glycosyltransferase